MLSYHTVGTLVSFLPPLSLAQCCPRILNLHQELKACQLTDRTSDTRLCRGLCKRTCCVNSMLQVWQAWCAAAEPMRQLVHEAEASLGTDLARYVQTSRCWSEACLLATQTLSSARLSTRVHRPASQAQDNMHSTADISVAMFD